jgi:hypothetical protein
MVENIAPEYPPAEEPPPENAFDILSFANQVINAGAEAGLTPKVDAEGHLSKASIFGVEKVDTTLRLLGYILNLSPEILQKLVEGVAGMATPFLKVLVSVATGILKPGMNTLAELTGAYVDQVAASGLETKPGEESRGRGPAGDATKLVFDKIMAPLLGLVTPASPRDVGGGETNAQHILGTIISLHLSTWMVNIISNLTGLGALKWINSFDDAITSGISARGFSRMATRPYLDAFVVKPATRDLNRQYPLELGSVGGLMKRYNQGRITSEKLKSYLKGLGYDDDVVADLLLDYLKLFSVDDLVYLMDGGVYGFDDAVEALKQQGYPENVARTKLAKPYWDRVDAQYRSLASSLVAAFIDRRIDNTTVRYLLQRAGFDQEEINAMVARGATLQEIPIRLSLAQVRDLYNEGVEDLAFVQGFLQDEGYSPDDVDRLVLLYFTKKEERDARKAALADAKRNRAEAQAAKDKAALAAQQAESLLLG